MRSAVRRAARVLVPLIAAAVATSSQAAAAPRPGEADARHALANGCYDLRSERLNQTVREDAGPFRMQATDLGSYLLFGEGGTFLTAQDDGSVAPSAAPTERADWRVDVRGDGFTLTLRSGDALATGAAGRLVISRKPERFTFEAADDCPRYPDSDTDVSGEPSKGAAPWAATRGLFDSHLHWMAFDAFGGNAHCGRPWHRYGVARAMVDCPDHEPGGAGLLLENALSGNDPAATHDTTGWPAFRDWPRPTSLTHEGTYHRWVERSWRGGLRLMVNLFVDSSTICRVWPTKRHSCNEMDGVRREIAHLRRLQDYVDAQFGGPGKGWLRIVTDPFEARRVINQGKLAVVLGIETSQLFDCRLRNGVPACDEGDIDERLAEVRAAGVRSLEIAVKTDNALSGAAGDPGTNGVVTNAANRAETGRFFDMRTCEGDQRAADKAQLTAGPIAASPLVTLVRGLDPHAQIPVYPPPPHCNARGLSDLGEHLVNRIVDHRMVLDPDHMSALARIRALDLLEARGYSGVISSHSWSTPADEPRIFRLGGLVVPKSSDIGKASDSRWFAGEWRRLRELRDRRYLFGFGFGSDMNGVAKQPVPRPDQRSNRPVTYPFTSYDGRQVIRQATTGQRTWDFNADGVAQYGLYLDWLQELRQRAGERFVRDMLRGPEAYLQMWERAVGVPGRSPLARRALFGPRGVTGVRLGASARRLLRSAGQPQARGARTWRWPVRGGGHVTSVLSRRGRTVLVGSTAPEHGLSGIRPGDPADALRRRSRAIGSGVRVRRAPSRAWQAFGVRDGRVRFVAVAARPVGRSSAGLLGAVRALRPSG